MYFLLGCLLVIALVLEPGKTAPVTHDVDKLGAVASESAICSNIGIGLLKRGVRAPYCSGTLVLTHVTTGECC
jgi:hypothetical protein